MGINGYKLSTASFKVIMEDFMLHEGHAGMQEQVCIKNTALSTKYVTLGDFITCC